MPHLTVFRSHSEAMHALDQLRAFTTVVADTGDYLALAQYRPQDATTNPSLVLKSVQDVRYLEMARNAIRGYQHQPEQALERLLVRFGQEILQLIPGRVSTEVDARFSFDVQASLAQARRLIGLYEAEGIGRERVLIKVASTYEGIEAARQLEHEGIHCNLTLLFALEQAVLCGQAGVTLISPFVGRIYDWYKKAAGAQWQEPDHAQHVDPGVASVRAIYAYYQRHGIKTQIMGASFRNMGQVLALAGCELLTISPALLAQLQASSAQVTPQLTPALASEASPEPLDVGEAAFRFALNENAMASEKLGEGIRLFAADTRTLLQWIASHG